MRIFDRTIRIEDLEPGWLGLCNTDISLADIAVKVVGFRVHPVAAFAFLVTGLHSLDRVLDRDVEEEREIGFQTAGGKFNYLFDGLPWKAATGSLVSERRVGITVGYDDASLGERGFDQKLDVLRAIGGKEQKLGHRRDGLFRLEKCFAQTSAQRRTAGFLRRDHVDATRAQVAGEHTKLR